jgi:hypothetical protein
MWFQLAVKRYNGTAWVTEAGGIDSTLLQTKTATGLNVVIPSGSTGGTVGVNGAVTIGSAVSSVTVNGAFSSTYDNYKIIVTGGVASVDNISMRLRMGSTTSGYDYGAIFGGSGGSGGFGGTAEQNFIIGDINTNTNSASTELMAPNLPRYTTMQSAGYNLSNLNMRHYVGVLKDTNQYTAFTILPSSGTLTGGTIRIYGYNNA